MIFSRSLKYRQLFHVTKLRHFSTSKFIFKYVYKEYTTMRDLYPKEYLFWKEKKKNISYILIIKIERRV